MSDSEISISRRNKLINQVVFVNGFPGCGKTMLSPIIATFERVEIMQYPSLIEQICELNSIDALDKDVAESMIKMNADLLLYNVMMGRQTNCRPRDLSSIFRHKPITHIKRMLAQGDEKIPDIIGIIAAIKDEHEIQSLKTAIEITDTVFDLIIPDLKIGAIEKNIAAKISYLFKMNGAEGDSYESIIGSGYLGALPHARPTDKAFEKGDFVVMDFGALYNGYHADMTRTVVIGEATSRHEEIYSIVLKSQLAGIDYAKAGVTGEELDNQCRTVIADAGYGDKFIHSTGHGIGLEVHTYPRISSYNKLPLLENYVITIEPGIYIPKWGGVRIEDDCLIQKNSCTPLNTSTKEMLVLK